MWWVGLEAVDSWMGSASVERSPTEALATEDDSTNCYELDPDESFAFGCHGYEGPGGSVLRPGGRAYLRNR